jgi:hypothetical protein
LPTPKRSARRCGGREVAAGINHLPADQLDTFIEAFHRQYQDSV